MVGSRTRIIVAVSALTAVAVAALLLRRGAVVPAPVTQAAAPPAVRDVEPSAAREGNAESDRAASPGEARHTAKGPLSQEPDAQRLTYLAETSDDPRVVEASLAAILSTYAARSTRKPGPDADLERVLVKHVKSERPATAIAALAAARIVLMAEQPRDGVTSAISELAAPQSPPPRRYAALEALNQLRPDRRAAHVLVAFERALDASEPHLVSMALLAFSQSGPSLESLPEPARARLAKRVAALIGHYDPGVRGGALLAMAELPSLIDHGVRIAAGERALADRDAYVRARGADLLARCREPAAIHLLIEHIGDLTLARYELSGWSRLDGSPGTLVHELAGRKRVAEAALVAIRSLSESLDGASPLRLKLGRQPSNDVVLDNAAIASSWYEAHRGIIPTRSFR
jgi:hypothetical protein